MRGDRQNTGPADWMPSARSTQGADPRAEEGAAHEIQRTEQRSLTYESLTSLRASHFPIGPGKRSRMAAGGAVENRRALHTSTDNSEPGWGAGGSTFSFRSSFCPIL